MGIIFYFLTMYRVSQKKLPLRIWDLDSSWPTDPFDQLDVAQLSQILIIYCWKVRILSPSLQFINYLSDLSSVGNNIVHFLEENWLGYLKMSLLLILGDQKAEKFKKTKWGVFCGTPCIPMSKQVKITQAGLTTRNMYGD